MALATQCPHCGTTFRVAHDQLKLRAGLVRCGACKEIFNGVEHLLPAMETAPSPAPETEDTAAFAAAAADSPAAAAEPDIGEPDEPFAAFTAAPAADDGERSGPHPEPDTAAEIEPAPPMLDAFRAESAAPDPLQRMTLMDFARDDESVPVNTSAEDAAELERAMADLQRSPLRRSSKWSAPEWSATAAAEAIEDSDEPEFMARARRQQRGGRTRRALLACTCLLLLLGALGQAAYAFRGQIAARFPQVKPLLATACAALACRIELPMQIESVTIESSELQALAPDKNTFALSLLLRNRSSTVEAWPNIELTLNDTGEQPLVRRVFLPREYLSPAQNELQGFAANTEQPLKIYFELATQKAAGYRVYLFYS